MGYSFASVWSQVHEIIIKSLLACKIKMENFWGKHRKIYINYCTNRGPERLLQATQSFCSHSSPTTKGSAGPNQTQNVPFGPVKMDACLVGAARAQETLFLGGSSSSLSV